MTVKPESNELAPFAGRSAELSLLGQHAARARQGQPRVVLVEGEPGFGKSALLGHFLGHLPQARVLRASGEEAEAGLEYGLAAQLTAAGDSGAVAPGTDPLAAGAGLATVIGREQDHGLAVVAVDDLHWADGPSAAALLFALRRLRAERVLAVLTARPGGLAGLGEAWGRFAAGDYRTSRIRLGGLAAAGIVALGRDLCGAGLTIRAAARLRQHTGGSPLYCRLILEETGPADWREWDLRDTPLPAPPALAGLLLARAAQLSGPARALLDAAAVLGQAASLAAVAALAGLPDPVPPLDEAAAAGLVKLDQGPEGTSVDFGHPLIRQAVRESLAPTLRRRLHQRAAEVLTPRDALGHRFAAAAGPDVTLAADLEAAASSALEAGRPGRACDWLVQASAVSPDPADRGRLLADALEAVLSCGDASTAEALAGRVADTGPGARQDMLLGQLDLLAGRVQNAQVRLTRAWQAHDRAAQPQAGAWAALHLVFCCAMSGRLPEAVTWAERAVAAAAGDSTLRPYALGAKALALAAGHRGREALACLGFLPAAPAEVPLPLTDVLVNRGMVRVMTEDLAAAVGDLAAAVGRMRSGTPLRYPGQCLGYLAHAQYRLGNWDDARVHAELAVSAARESGRRNELSFVHACATFVPAAAGDWDEAGGHLAQADEAARASGSVLATAAWATARAVLATAREDHDDVLAAAAAVRRTGRANFPGGPACYGWRTLEAGALISTGDLARADRSLAELELSLTSGSPASAWMTVAMLRGRLAVRFDDADGAATAFARAWRYARGLPLPFHLARLELADGRRLRQAGRRPEAIARLRSARARLSALGAGPYLAACDSELASCGIAAPGEAAPETLGLTPGELAVARLVANGRSNREAAAELYVSVKAIEFHLSNVFTKLGITSRREIAGRLFGVTSAHPVSGQVLAGSGVVGVGWGKN